VAEAAGVEPGPAQAAPKDREARAAQAKGPTMAPARRTPRPDPTPKDRRPPDTPSTSSRGLYSRGHSSTSR